MNTHERLATDAQEIAGDKEVDLIDSERRIRLYNTLNNLGLLKARSEQLTCVDEGERTAAELFRFAMTMYDE